MTDDLSDLFEEDEPARDAFPVPSAPATIPFADVARAIDLSQAAFQPVVDELVELYRTLDKTYRKDIKAKLKAVYEKLAALGVTFGVSRLSMANLWKA
jgi:hypothetical protein